MQKIKEWYADLDNNEQKIVKIAAIFFILVIIVFVILVPLNKTVNSLQKQVEGRQKSIEKWKDAMPKLLASRGASSGQSGSDSLSRIITSSTKQFNLRVSRMQEKNNNEIQVWFDNIPFNDFIKWTAKLQNTYKASVSSVNIRSKDRNGLSSIDVKIKKG